MVAQVVDDRGVAGGQELGPAAVKTTVPLIDRLEAVVRNALLELDPAERSARFQHDQPWTADGRQLAEVVLTTPRGERSIFLEFAKSSDRMVMVPDFPATAGIEASQNFKAVVDRHLQQAGLLATEWSN